MIPLLFLLVCGSLYATPQPVELYEHVIATNLNGALQVVVADVNKDGKPDIITILSGDKELVWLENPTWRRHVIVSDLYGMVNVAAVDIDRDGVPELVLTHEFAEDPANSLGILSVLKQGADPQRPWKIMEFDRVPTSRRLRWADVKGDGKPALINAPYSGVNPSKTPLLMYKPGGWIRETVNDDNQGPVSGLNVARWDGDNSQSVLTATPSGINLFRFGPDAAWAKTTVATVGSLDVAGGSLRKREERTRFIAALDPAPTTQISVYSLDARTGWRRQIIADGLYAGGSIITVDLDGDGSDEIVSSGYVFYSIGIKGERWSKFTVDTGFGPAECAASDFNRDGKADLACVNATGLKWYENRGVRK